MIDLDWLQDRLVAVLKWQLANAHGDDAPEVPFAGRRVWSIFLALNETRTAGMAANPIAYSEIRAYAWLTGEPVRPFEVTIIRVLDAAFLAAVREKREPDSTPAVDTTRPLTPMLFDVTFGARG